MEPGLEATTFFEPSNFTYPFGTHICVVEIDAETGDVKLVRYVAVDDCGNVINPLLVDGQVHGGIVQSVGQALLEEAVYDEQGQLITGELMDYALPRASDMCWMETDAHRDAHAGKSDGRQGRRRSRHHRRHAGAGRTPSPTRSRRLAFATWTCPSSAKRFGGSCTKAAGGRNDSRGV